MIIYPIFLLAILTSCGFSESSDDNNSFPEDMHNERLLPPLIAEEDHDGDFLTNEEEARLGTNPRVADLPDVRTRFIQNYKIQVDYKNLSNGEIGSFDIDTKIHQDDPGFKYRVGDLFVKKNSELEAARIGRYSNHSYGTFQETDYSWVSYPEVDPGFYAEKVLLYSKYFNPEKYEISNISIELENSIRLRGNHLFKSIKNLEISYLYYDYEKETYQKIKTAKVDRHFHSETNEVFKVKIENVPVQLIKDNFLKRGEFIISELTDYEIPALEIKHSNLLSSVRSRSIPVYFSTPLERSVKYIGTGGKEMNFQNIVASMFGNDFEINQNTVRKIGQFENNLQDYEYLDEIKNEDKKGKWFLFTNELDRDYLDHKYSRGDFISLNYIPGKVPANQISEKILGVRKEAKSNENEGVYPLGNISNRSKIEFQLSPKLIWGENKENRIDTFRSGGSCAQTVQVPNSPVKFMSISSIRSTLRIHFKDFSEELGRISLVVDKNNFQLSELIREKKVIATWRIKTYISKLTTLMKLLSWITQVNLLLH